MGWRRPSATASAIIFCSFAAEISPSDQLRSYPAASLDITGSGPSARPSTIAACCLQPPRRRCDGASTGDHSLDSILEMLQDRGGQLSKRRVSIPLFSFFVFFNFFEFKDWHKMTFYGNKMVQGWAQDDVLWQQDGSRMGTRWPNIALTWSKKAPT